VEEQILCFKREILRAYPAKTFYDEGLWHQLLAHLEPKARSVAEHDYDTKQLVVYVLINHGETFLSYQRTPKTAETRLKALYSIGIGGHVNVDDQLQPTLFGAKEATWKDFVLRAVRPDGDAFGGDVGGAIRDSSSGEQRQFLRARRRQPDGDASHYLDSSGIREGAGPGRSSASAYYFATHACHC
jgi:hypothetical protein